MKYPARCFIILLVFCFALPALATQRNVKTGYGAVGDGVHDDTTNINNAIAAMVGGDELYFPCGTYLITSNLSWIQVSNTTVDGAVGCATIKASGALSSGYMWRIGSGSFNPGSHVGLASSANELASSFTLTSNSLGFSTGDYVFIKEGETQYAQVNYNGDGMACDYGGCRADMLHIASVSGSTITVDTAVHYLYDTTLPISGCSTNSIPCDAPMVFKPGPMVSGVNFHDLTLDGSGDGCITSCGTGIGLYVYGVVNSTIATVTTKNVAMNGINAVYGYNNTFSNITMTHTAGAQQAAWLLARQGHLTINGGSLTQFNSTGSTHGFQPFETTDATFSNVTVDHAAIPGGALYGGRTVKYNSTSYTTNTGMLIENNPVCANPPNVCGAAGGTEGPGYNGLSIENFSSHNTFSNCTIINNGGDGVTGFNESSNFNTFNNCTMYGNGIYQFNVSSSDNNWTISGGTYGPSWADTDVIGFSCCGGVTTGNYVHEATIKGPGSVGIGVVASSSGCINSNTFTASTGLGAGINAATSAVIGSGNTMNGLSSNLTAGTCGGGGAGPAPPSGLTATVQ